MNSILLSVADLDDGDVDRILKRAGALDGSNGLGHNTSRRVVALLFLETSLRTRVGFAVAASRLGWQSIDVFELRQSPASMIESSDDTLRTVSGISDVVVSRPSRPLDRATLEKHVVSGFINGGDTGPRAEHPTQALIDLYAIEKALGPVAELRVAICGDPRMRAVRSLLQLFVLRRPLGLSIIASPNHVTADCIPEPLTSVADFRTLSELDDIDVLYVAGMPHASLPLAERDRLILTSETVSLLPQHAIVLSPLPIIDEVDEVARRDGRMRMFWQSDQSVFVRMALLEEMVASR